ncbi:hypothetical protein GXW82_42695 [Streptacidiphilus sp. 4-A2]|nr:hypothetical protein [Streptacidiphilus sp. 4-A2]
MQTYDTYLPRAASPTASTTALPPAAYAQAAAPGAPAQQIPAMRPAFEGETSATPSSMPLLRVPAPVPALPGDREGEEELRFTGFGYQGGSGYAAWERPAPYSQGYGPSHSQGYGPGYGQGYGSGYGPGQGATPGSWLTGRHRGYLSLPPGQG